MEELIWAYGSEGVGVHTMEERVMLQEKGPPASNSKQEAERAISGDILSLPGP